MAQVSVSILAADFSRLAEQINSIEAYADRIHYDVMDGHFVPNITFGPVILESVNKITKLPIEAHLMIEKPSLYLEDFAKAGADSLIIHVEADKNSLRTLNKIREIGLVPGVALNPSTPLSAIENILDAADTILVMTADPGFAGQKFVDSMLPKIKRLKEMLNERKLKAEIEVDCGINLETGKKAKGAGADILVASSFIYKSSNPVNAIKELKKI